jgi:hypothetical protein
LLLAESVFATTVESLKRNNVNALAELKGTLIVFVPEIMVTGVALSFVQEANATMPTKLNKMKRFIRIDFLLMIKTIE